MKKYENDEVFAKFVVYMQKALYHKRIDYIRKKSVIQNTEILIEETQENIGNFSVIKSKISYLEILNAKELEVLKLHYELGFKYQEIADMKDLKVTTVKQIRNRAILKVKKKMEEDYD